MTNTIPIDVKCSCGCGQWHTYKPRLVRGSRELQDQAIERHLRRCGWTGEHVSSLMHPHCAQEACHA